MKAGNRAVIPSDDQGCVSTITIINSDCAKEQWGPSPSNHPSRPTLPNTITHPARVPPSSASGHVGNDSQLMIRYNKDHLDRQLYNHITNYVRYRRELEVERRTRKKSRKAVQTPLYRTQTARDQVGKPSFDM